MAAHRSLRPAAFALGIVLLIGGILVIALLGWPKVRTARASATWPTASGEIAFSRVRARLVGGKRTYGAEIAYRFSVGKKSYDGTSIHLGGEYQSTNPADAEQIAARFPVGQQVTVHYDPLDPSRAVLEPGVALNHYAMLTLGIAVASVGLMMVVPLTPSVLARGNVTIEPVRCPHVLARFRRWSSTTRETADSDAGR